MKGIFEMPQYLKLAEKIYNQVKNLKGFTEDPVEDLNNLMIELRSSIKETKFKLLYNYIDFEELVMGSKNTSIDLDISLIPKSKYVDEYILWLASFIERITVCENNKALNLNNKIILPNYHYDDSGNIINLSKNNGEEIISYFKNNDSF